MKSILNFFNRTTDPDSPASGKVSFYFKNDVPFWKNSAGLVLSLMPKIFGDNFNLSVFEDYTATKSGTTWTTYAGTQFPNDVSGTFIVFVYAMIRMNSTGGDAKLRLALDGDSVGSIVSEELKDSSSTERVPKLFIKKIDITGGEYLDLDMATERSGDTLTVYEGAIALWRVA